MYAGSPRPAQQSPATLDCKIYSLPTVIGLSQSDGSTSTTAELWSALAEAVMSERAFDEIEFERNRDGQLADVVDLSSYRQERQQRKLGS